MSLVDFGLYLQHRDDFLPIRRPHRFAVGDLVRHVDAAAGNELTVVALTWRTRAGTRFPTYELTSPSGGETVRDVLDTTDIAAI